MVDTLRCYRNKVTRGNVFDGLQLNADRVPDRIVEYIHTSIYVPHPKPKEKYIQCQNTPPDILFAYAVQFGVPGTKRFAKQYGILDPKLPFADKRGTIYHVGDTVEFHGQHFVIAALGVDSPSARTPLSPETVAANLSIDMVSLRGEESLPVNPSEKTEYTPLSKKAFTELCPTFAMHNCSGGIYLYDTSEIRPVSEK